MLDVLKSLEDDFTQMKQRVEHADKDFQPKVNSARLLFHSQSHNGRTACAAVAAAALARRSALQAERATGESWIGRKWEWA